MKDAMGPDAVSRNHSRAPPCSTSAVVTRRKNASMRTSMNRAFPTRERRCRAEKSPRRVSTSAGGGARRQGPAPGGPRAAPRGARGGRPPPAPGPAGGAGGGRGGGGPPPPRGGPTRPRPPPRGGRRRRSSQVVERAGRVPGFGRGRVGLAGLALAERLVHRRLEVVAEVVAEFPAHLLHEPGRARGVVLVEIAEVRRVRERFQARLLRFHGGEARHHAAQAGSVTARAGRRRGRGGTKDEQADPVPTVMTLVLVNRHAATNLSTRCERPAGAWAHHTRIAPILITSPHRPRRASGSVISSRSFSAPYTGRDSTTRTSESQPWSRRTWDRLQR